MRAGHQAKGVSIRVEACRSNYPIFCAMPFKYLVVLQGFSFYFLLSYLADFAMFLIFCLSILVDLIF